MSCRPAPSFSPAPQSPVSADQYNALLARLDAEIQLRTQLEADLVASREEAAFLHRRLADITAPRRAERVPPAITRPHLYRPTSSAAVSQEPVAMDTDAPGEKQENVLPARDTGKGHDKEILSHCSDISACKSAARTPDLKKTIHRKSSTNLAAMNGVVKKSKSKKERQAKVKIAGQSRYWTPDEHKLFLEALNKFGHKDLRSISTYVGTRNMTQVRTHSQKYFMRLMREAKRQNPVGTRSSNVSGDEATAAEESTAPTGATSVAPRPVSSASGVDNSKTDAASVAKEADTGDKYSVPNTCGMTLLCLVGEDTLAA